MSNYCLLAVYYINVYGCLDMCSSPHKDTSSSFLLRVQDLWVPQLASLVGWSSRVMFLKWRWMQQYWRQAGKVNRTDFTRKLVRTWYGHPHFCMYEDQSLVPLQKDILIPLWITLTLYWWLRSDNLIRFKFTSLLETSGTRVMSLKPWPINKELTNQTFLLCWFKYISTIYEQYLIISRIMDNRWYICSNNFLQTKVQDFSHIIYASCFLLTAEILGIDVKQYVNIWLLDSMNKQSCSMHLPYSINTRKCHFLKLFLFCRDQMCISSCISCNYVAKTWRSTNSLPVKSK